jgi:arginyl-tRNA synthetase
MSVSQDFDPKAHLTELIGDAIRAVTGADCSAPIALERPKQAQHGDYACNIALQLAKAAKRNPRELAQAIVMELGSSPYLDQAEIAGPGFINLRLKPIAKQVIVTRVLKQGERFGQGKLGRGKKIQVEFVSANPTGPLHVGHGRGAAYGASLANVLAAADYAVQREYYVNDAGRQMDILALSTWLRYLDHHGVKVPFPPNAYQGDYVGDMARQISVAHGDRYVRDGAHILDNVPPAPPGSELDLDWLSENESRFSKHDFDKLVTAAKERLEHRLDALIANAKTLLGDDYDYVHRFVLTEQLGDCRNDLAEFGVHFDCWFSETSLHDNGGVARAIEQLDKRGHIYTQDGAKWFRASHFGDEKDRVVQRENGQYTYFASDIAYHANKFERGFDTVVNVWGADHHGYIPRVKAVLKALDIDADRLQVPLVQFAVLYQEGQKMSMSTRAGEFVTLRELRKEVGNDAARFFYVLRKSDQHLDFDLDLAKSQTNENPVYYIQYAHARITSVLEKWGGHEADLAAADPGPLTGTHESLLLQQLAEYPEVIETAALDYAPHAIAHYLRELAGTLHSYYNAEQFLVDDEPIKLARLALVGATRQVLRNGLALLGVGAPDKM